MNKSMKFVFVKQPLVFLGLLNINIGPNHDNQQMHTKCFPPKVTLNKA